MPAPLSYKNDEEQDKRLDPFDSDYTSRGLDDAENFANDNSSDDFDDSSSASDNVNDFEESAPRRNNQFGFEKESGRNKNTKSASSNNQNQTGRQKITGFTKGLLKKRGFLIGGGVGVGIASILALFSMMLPLKMFALVDNVMSAASAIPEYAAERRTEYIATRAFATWLIKKSNGNSVTDAQVKGVFCKGAGIGCSLTWTAIDGYFQKHYELDTKVINDSGTTRKQTIREKGRTKLGGKARSWTIDINTRWKGKDLGVGKQVEIVKNSEMKRHLRNNLEKHMAGRNFLVRKLAMRALMKKHGVTHFRAFEKTSNKIADFRTSLKAKIYTNTVGKVSSKLTNFLACALDGPEVCRKTLENRGDGKASSDSGDDLDDDTKEKRKNARDSTKDIKVDADGEMAKHFLSKKILAGAGGALAIAGTLDLIFSGIAASANGGLEEMMYQIRSATYIGFAFGDEAGVIPNIDRIKAGDSVDPIVMSEMANMFENVEESPVFQAETGLIPAGTDAKNAQWTRTCDTGEKDEEVQLEKGAMMCPERSLLRDYSSWFETPVGKILKNVANAWKKSIGKVFDWAGDGVGFLMDKLGFSAAIGWLSDTLGVNKALEWILSLFIDIPTVGPGVAGSDNYDAVSAASWVSQNEIMAGGVDPGSDEVSGGGGKALSPEQVAAVQNDMMNEQKDEYNSSSVLAKLFDSDLKGSFINNVIAALPMSTFTSSIGVLQVPAVALSSLTTLPQASAAQSQSPQSINPHGINLYGYEKGDSALTEDISLHTESYCKKSAEKREKSYVPGGSGKRGHYTETDPCALDRVAVGGFLDGAGITDDKYSLPEPFDQTGGDGGEDQPESSGDVPDGDTQELAKKILDSKNITINPSGDSSNIGYLKQMKNTADGKAAENGIVLDKRVLQIILIVAENTKVNISSILRVKNFPNGNTSSLHNSGKAVDFNEIGSCSSGRGGDCDKAIQRVIDSGVIKDGGGFGQKYCSGAGNMNGKITSSGHITFKDACTHLHIQTPKNNKDTKAPKAV